jgi:predicted DsbA family dithiol-disulfide isomerase
VRSAAVNLIVVLAVLAPRPVCAQADSVVATIGDYTIRESDVNRRWEKDDPLSFSELHERMYMWRKRALDELITDHLLAVEADRRGMTPLELTKTEILDKLQPISEAQLRAFYDQRSANLPSDVTFNRAKSQISDFLHQEAFERAKARYVAQLGNSVTMFFKPFRHAIKIEPHDRVIGNRSAPVQIVEFGDFECPFCKRIQPVIQKLLRTHGEKIAVIWKDFPLPNHLHARSAAEAARCADDQGAFWKYHEVLFANQSTLTVEDLKKYAGQIGLTPDAFGQCLDGGKYRVQVANAVAEGRSQGVSATPAIFVNGRPFVGTAEFATLDDMISKEFAAPVEWRLGP